MVSRAKLELAQKAKILVETFGETVLQDTVHGFKGTVFNAFARAHKSIFGSMCG